MSNTIREDVVKIDFDIGSSLKEIKKLRHDFDELKKKITGGIDDGAFDDLKNDAKQSGKALDEVKKLADEVKRSVSDIGKKASKVAFSGLKKLAGISFKALSIGISGLATGLGYIGKKSVEAYADYEQLAGGVETLFGAQGAKSVEEYAKLTGKSVNDVRGEYKSLMESQSLVMKNANNAYKNAGLSANEYMETVTGFAASLKQSVGGDVQKAAELADVAVKDMADNSNKLGTSMESIQYAYAGFSKQNYTIKSNSLAA